MKTPVLHDGLSRDERKAMKPPRRKAGTESPDPAAGEESRPEQST